MTANPGAFKKGEKRPNQGKRGPGKVTQEFRETVQKLLDDNRDNMAMWLKSVAEGDATKDTKPNPAKAFELLSSLAEFAAPKLARTEHTGEGGGPVQTERTVRFVKSEQDGK